MQFQRKRIVALVWLALGMLAITPSFAGIYMGTSANISGPAYNPAVVQPIPALQPPPVSQVATTRAVSKPQTYHKTVKPVTQPCEVSRPCSSASYHKPAAKVAPKPIVKAEPKPYIPPPKPENVYYVSTGSLRDNVIHIVDQSEWGRVIWNVPYDYRWVGNLTIHAISVQDALTQLLDQYPVQATFYEENHVVAITPRRQA